MIKINKKCHKEFHQTNINIVEESIVLNLDRTLLSYNYHIIHVLYI